ncbi:MAG: uracil-DNA glycosylase [Chloroflexi bacterium]|nr:MAG: uracil-DNA glycosylase [Chloroflexota bacterium]
MNNASLEELAALILKCRQCPLGALRTHAVPGEGPPDAEIMFIGEGPGYYEDRQGRPFVGASGQFLEQLLAGIHLTREQVFIANVIKCRPPNNRDPLPREIEACTPYLNRQIEIIDPLLIVTLGRFSMAQFFPPSARITRIHGRPLYTDRRAILPMFHPAAALRNPQWQTAMRQDFARIPALLEEMREKRREQDRSDADGMEQLSLF